MEHRMLDAKRAGAFLLTGMVASALAADVDPPETAKMLQTAPLRWLGVEVVTNDFDRDTCRR
jgi:hypothetical protein